VGRVCIVFEGEDVARGLRLALNFDVVVDALPLASVKGVSFMTGGARI
jgi:hypothetical protein